MEVFKRLGVVDYPTRGIVNDNGTWKVSDVGTGEVLTSFPAHDAESYILCVLDGDHFLTDYCEVFSTSEGKVIQMVPELNALLNAEEEGGELQSNEFMDRMVTSLPAPKKNAYT